MENTVFPHGQQERDRFLSFTSLPLCSLYCQLDKAFNFYRFSHVLCFNTLIGASSNPFAPPHISLVSSFLIVTFFFYVLPRCLFPSFISIIVSISICLSSQTLDSMFTVCTINLKTKSSCFSKHYDHSETPK